MELAEVVAAVDELIQTAGVQAPPTPLDLLASYRNIRDIKVIPMAQAGRLVPVGSQFEIHVNSGDSTARRRFSVAHEIAHTFFPISGSISDTIVGSFAHPEDSEEYLCDVAAARMLFHPRWLDSLAEMVQPGLDGFLSIRDSCDASIEATANALARSGKWPSWSLVVWEPGLRKEERRNLGQLVLGDIGTQLPEQKMRVVRTYAAPNSPFMPRNKSAAPGTSIERAWREEIRVEAEEVLGTGHEDWVVQSEAMFAPYVLASGQMMPRVVSSISWRNRSTALSGRRRRP